MLDKLGNGAIAYYLLAGQLPTRSVDRMMSLSISATKKLLSLHEHKLTVNRRTEQVMAKALEINPADRFQTTAQMRQAICPPCRFILLPF